MSQDAFGLQYEFVSRHGHCMELYKEDGLKANELSTLQLRMLDANQVPRLLPLELHEIDTTIRLQYQLSTRRMLSQVVKVESMSLQQFAKLAFGIVCTLLDSPNYMLIETNHILKDNFIFLGRDWSDVYLTYVPLDNPLEAEELNFALVTLFRKLTLHLVEADRSHLPIWIQEESQAYRLQDAKAALLCLMDETSIDTQMANAVELTSSTTFVQSSVNPTPSNLPKPHWKTKSENSEQGSIQSLPQSSNKQLRIPTVGDQMVSHNHVKPRFTPLQPREKWFSIAIGVLLIVFLWQLYASYPSTSNLQIIAGMTLLLVDIGFLIVHLGRPNLRLRGTSAVRGAITDSAISAAATCDRHTLGSEEQAVTDMANYYQSLPMLTTLLRPPKPNATVFLGKLQVQQPAVPRLVVLVNGETQSLPIGMDVFTIGRGDGGCKVDYELAIAGVSRIHAEISRTTIGYELKDVGSTNGTYLNGEALVNYQAYPLKEGDVIRIIRQELTYREGNK